MVGKTACVEQSSAGKLKGVDFTSRIGCVRETYSVDGQVCVCVRVCEWLSAKRIKQQQQQQQQQRHHL
jgi:hypothetical protein